MNRIPRSLRLHASKTHHRFSKMLQKPSAGCGRSALTRRMPFIPCSSLNSRSKEGRHASFEQTRSRASLRSFLFHFYENRVIVFSSCSRRLRGGIISFLHKDFICISNTIQMRLRCISIYDPDLPGFFRNRSLITQHGVEHRSKAVGFPERLHQTLRPEIGFFIDDIYICICKKLLQLS